MGIDILMLSLSERGGMLLGVISSCVSHFREEIRQPSCALLSIIMESSHNRTIINVYNGTREVCYGKLDS